MNLVPNGYLAQSISEGPARHRRSASGKAWPLESIQDPEAVALTRRTAEWFPRFDREGRFTPWATPSADFATEYVATCRKLKIQVRLLSCRSERTDPQADFLIPGEQILGWDVVSASFDYSLVADELAEDDQDFAQYSRRLNASGLFETREELNDFLAFRERLVQAGHNLESLEETIPVLLGEYPIFADQGPTRHRSGR
jgi:hypothetical protein